MGKETKALPRGGALRLKKLARLRGTSMLDRFTDRARKVMSMAKQEALLHLTYNIKKFADTRWFDIHYFIS